MFRMRLQNATRGLEMEILGERRGANRRVRAPLHDPTGSRDAALLGGVTGEQ